VTTLALDTFTGATGSALSAHTPDLGGGSWVVDVSNWQIQFNQVTVSGSQAAVRWARFANPIADDYFEVFVEFFRGSTDTGNPEAGIWFLAKGLAGEGCRLFARRKSNATVDLLFERRDASLAVVQQVSVATGLPAPLQANGFRFGVEVRGLTVTPFTEPYGGGTRTRYSDITLTADLRDGAHRLIGLSAWWITSDAGRFFLDNLTVIGLNQPPTAPGPFSSPPPEGTAVNQGTPVLITWSPASDPDGDPVQYAGEYFDPFAGWLPLFPLQPQTTFSWDTTPLIPGNAYLVHVRAHDGLQYGPFGPSSPPILILPPAQPNPWQSIPPAGGSWASTPPAGGSWSSGASGGGL
jgi:hypothetical protein